MWLPYTMGMKSFLPDYLGTKIPEFENTMVKTAEKDRANPGSKNYLNQSLAISPLEMHTSDYIVAFSGQAQSYCVGIVDMVNSTRISANLHERDWCKYYAIFLNSMSKILHKFGGVAIKNGGDSLLYYFPQSATPKGKYGFISCLECSLSMVESHEVICNTIQKEGLPPLDYRVSADYGRVVIMNANNSTSIDVIGPPVNMCSKINHMAEKNRVVIGGDLYEMIKDYEDFKLKQTKGFSIGLKYTYPIYSLTRK